MAKNEENDPIKMAKAAKAARELAEDEERIAAAIERAEKAQERLNAILEKNQTIKQKSLQIEEEERQIKEKMAELEEERVKAAKELARLQQQLNNGQAEITDSTKQEIETQQEILKNIRDQKDNLRDKRDELKRQQGILEENSKLQEKYGKDFVKNLQAAQKEAKSTSGIVASISKEFGTLGSKMASFIQLETKALKIFEKMDKLGLSLGGNLGKAIQSFARKGTTMISGLGTAFILTAAAMALFPASSSNFSNCSAAY